MRIMIKGGVWKNTEDEILKAAVMKYGKNQWARISSLLVRKSAKQCKARWYEWLDPSIKKTEWTREEDEKLLHLAKLMPTQWRTIAPIVGRTPSQCLERYEKLLDAACMKDENYEPGDDPRKLRPGEIDPNPESKPARPDPVDMDEDEKEMLSEARARLANTRGKKAKRKAREKQLEEARRLASLQKRRELKAAGIHTRLRKRKRRGIDYNAEIPFEKRPPPGFFDVSSEDKPMQPTKFPTTIDELEGKRRVDVEAQLRKQDLARNKIAQRQDAPSAIIQSNKLNDPEAVRKRSKLMLPAPQISDQELEEIAKMGYASDLIGNEELAGGSGATNALLANRSQTPRMGMPLMRTPQRTPSGKGDAIMMEAENLARLRESQTPLFGGENPELHPSDFSGVTPKKREIHTPNPMATPLSTSGPTGLTPRGAMTPRDGFSYSATPKGTPMRDELHINEDMYLSDSAKLELQRQGELQRNLRSGLTGLPQPRNEYQIVVHPMAEESEEIEEKIEEDMSDIQARQQAEEEARQKALLAKRSKVLQRELPRPPAESLELIRQSLTKSDEDKSSFVPPTPIEQADEMIRKELLTLLEHDNAKYPLDAEKEKKKTGKRGSCGKSTAVPEIEEFLEDRLNEAAAYIKEVTTFLRVAMGHEDEPLEEFSKARDACQEDLMYFPARNSYGLASVASNSDKLSALQSDFEIVKRKMDEETKKAQRLEQKLKVLTHGYQVRSDKLWSMIEETFKQMYTSATELECFEALQKQEQVAAAHRINDLRNDVCKQQDLERTLQSRYELLGGEQQRLYWRLEEYKIEMEKQAQIEMEKQAQIEMEKLQAQIELEKQAQIEMEKQAQIEMQKQAEMLAKAHIEVSICSDADFADPKQTGVITESEDNASTTTLVEDKNLVFMDTNMESKMVIDSVDAVDNAQVTSLQAVLVAVREVQNTETIDSLNMENSASRKVIQCPQEVETEALLVSNADECKEVAVTVPATDRDEGPFGNCLQHVLGSGDGKNNVGTENETIEKMVIDSDNSVEPDLTNGGIQVATSTNDKENVAVFSEHAKVEEMGADSVGRLTEDFTHIDQAVYRSQEGITTGMEHITVFSGSQADGSSENTQNPTSSDNEGKTEVICRSACYLDACSHEKNFSSEVCIAGKESAIRCTTHEKNMMDNLRDNIIGNVSVVMESDGQMGDNLCSHEVPNATCDKSMPCAAGASTMGRDNVVGHDTAANATIFTHANGKGREVVLVTDSNYHEHSESANTDNHDGSALPEITNKDDLSI